MAAKDPDTPVTHEVARKYVDTLVTAIEQGEIKYLEEEKETNFNVSEIVEGGSLGHGTAVLSKYDIDLVIYSRSDAVVAQGDQLFRKWLIPLRDFLKETFGQDYKATRMTKRSVQFKFKGAIDVDLLVSPYWTDQHEFYRFLKTIKPNQRDGFTVCACKWQVQFFKKQPPQVKEYARKAKAWRNEQWPEGSSGSGRPSSYLMSLLVVMAYEKNPKDVPGAIKELVGNGDTLNKCWAGEPKYFYKKGDYPTLLPSRPRIVDPANPANNVWVSGLKRYEKGEWISDYEPGDGNRAVIKSKIHSIKL